MLNGGIGFMVAPGVEGLVEEPELCHAMGRPPAPHAHQPMLTVGVDVLDGCVSYAVCSWGADGAPQIVLEGEI